MSDFNKPTNPPAFPSDAVKDPFDKSGMTLKEKVNLAMAWYDSGLEDRATFQTLMESILEQLPQRTWVGLTDEDFQPMVYKAMMYYGYDPKHSTLTSGAGFYELARAIENKLKQKNSFAEEKNI